MAIHEHFLCVNPSNLIRMTVLLAPSSPVNHNITRRTTGLFYLASYIMSTKYSYITQRTKKKENFFLEVPEILLVFFISLNHNRVRGI